GEFRMYIDGVSDTARNDDIDAVIPINTNGDDPVTIAAQIDNGSDPRRHWVGMIDEVAIWDRALTEAEILGIYNAGAPVALVDWRANGPDPADDADSDPRIVVDPDVTLQWASGVGAWPAVVSHSVYMGTAPDALTLVQNVPAAQMSLTVPGLTQDAIYYWRVDEHNSANLSDVNNIAVGATWAFNADMRPRIVTQPVDTRGWAGETVQLSVVTNNAVSYQWFGPSGALTDAGDISGATTDTLSIANVELADEGSFYCALDNTFGQTLTNTVQLAVKRLLAHWPLLENSPGDPNVTDISGNGHHGTFVGDPFFTAEGLDLDGNGDYVETGKVASEIGIGGNSERTVTCFAYVRSFDNGGLYNCGDYQGGQDFSLRTLGSDNLWRIQYWGGDWDFNTQSRTGFTTSLPAFSSHNEWVWFAHVHDGAHTKIYANGSLLLDWAKTINTTDVQTFRIGFYNGSDELNGILRDMRIYSAAMTAEEVGELYHELTGIPACETYDLADISGPAGVSDCVVDMYDVAAVAAEWAKCLLLPDTLCP
ncbi:MAG: hypothetical protein J7M40_12650, partial [Planctomycetes bacterium]|nr:hypothetical protein [Planctomycetota bacterium]